MDSNNLDSNNQIIMTPPKDFWEMLACEKILYKAKASGEIFIAFLGILAASICLYGFIKVCSSSLGKTLSEKLFSVLILTLLATLSFLFLRYSYNELKFYLGTRYLATPTRLLIGIEIPLYPPRTKVIVYWKDVATICKGKRTYICLLNKNIIVLRDREPNFYENIYDIWKQLQLHSENKDAINIDTNNKTNISSPKDIFEVLAGEKILYKAKTFGASFMPCMGWLLGAYMGISTIIGIFALLFSLLVEEEEPLSVGACLCILILCIFPSAAISFFCLRYSNREREFSLGTYLATPTRLLIGIELPGKKPKTKVIVDWKDVAAIFKKKRTYICLSNDKRIMLREKEPNTYENLYTVWQQSRLHS